MKAKTWISFACVGFALSIPSSGAASDDASLRRDTDAIFSKWDRPDSPGCAVSVMRDGAPVYQQGYGMANLEYGIPITPSSVFHVASVSKHVTAMGVHLLAQEGRLSLDDDIRKYVPEVPDFGKTITLRHLTHHTSGLRDQWSLLLMAGWRWEADVVTQADVLDITSRQKALNFEPGAEYLYSNTGFTLLAVVIERVTGKSLRAFTSERFFGPLGMHDTHFHDDHQMIVPNRAYAYDSSEGGGLHVSIPDFDVVGATSLFTTVSDLAHWDRAFYTASIGGPELLEALLARGRLNDGRVIPYAGGLVHGTYRGLKTISHGGADAGYRAHFLRFPEERFTVAVLCNFPTSNPAERAQAIADIYLTDRFSQPRDEPTPVELQLAALEPYVGLYRHPSADTTIELAVRDGGLALIGDSDLPLEPLGANRFRPRGSSTVFDVDGTRILVPDGADGTTRYELVDAADPQTLALEDYVGTYASDELGAEYTFKLDSGKLVLTHRKIGEKLLAPTFRDGFRFEGQALSFTRNEHGKVDGFTLSSGRVRRVRFIRVLDNPRRSER